MSNTINEKYMDFANEFSGMEAIITPEELKNMFSYIKNMEDNMSKLSGELESLKSKLDSQVQMPQHTAQHVALEKKTSIQEYLKTDFAGEKDELLTEMQEMMMELKGNIIEKADDIRNCVHEKNLEGLNVIFSKLHLKEFCERMSKTLEKTMKKTTNLMQRVEYVESELGQAKGHLKNIKDPAMPSNASVENVEFKVIKKGISTQTNLLSSMKEKTDAFGDKVGGLEKKVEMNQTHRQEKKKEDVSKILRLKDSMHSPIGLERC